MIRYFPIVILNILFYWVAIPLGLIYFGELLETIFPLSIGERFICPFTSFVLIALGLIIAIYATLYFIVVGLGLPISSISPKKLVKCGPYSFIRHPVYLGFILFILGLGFRTNTWTLITSIILSIFIILYALTFEERKLIKKYGDEYIRYKEKVGGFIPRKKLKEGNCPPLLFVLLYMFGHAVMPFFYRVEVERKCNIPLEKVVLISNHVSYLDFAFMLYAVKGYARFPISSEHFKKHEKFYENVGCFPIKRYAPDMKAIKMMVKILNERGRVGIFPEAERSWDGRFIGFKEGFDKLLLKFPKPYIGVRLEKVHLYFPRWSKRFKRGKIGIVVDKFYDVKSLEEFLSKLSVDPSDVYPNYAGIEYYLYMCPKCGKIMSIKGSKDGIECENCDFKLKKPTVEKIWKIHDEIKEKLSPPIEDDIFILNSMGKKLDKSKIKIEVSGDLKIGEEKIEPVNLKSMIVEGVKDIYLFDGKKLSGLRLINTSALMWQEIISNIVKTKNPSFQLR